MILRAILFATLAIPASAQQIVKTDEQAATEGEYLTYAAPWCRFHDTSLVAGRDYSNTVAYQSGALPNGVQITWRWPNIVSPKCGVWGYNFVSWGNYDGGKTRVAVTPRTVASLKTLRFTYGVDVAADPAGYNVLLETFLTRTAGKASDKAMEVGVFLHAPPSTRAWAAKGKQLGQCDGYSMAINPGPSGKTFATFIPAGTKTWGVWDAKAALDCLRAKGVIDGGWWINGAAIGIEPIKGIGTAVVRTWKVEVN